MLTHFHVTGYRSLCDVTLPLSRINVITGANGCGKSNLYRAMFLLHAGATGLLARTLADEGGMPSVLWAGARKKGPVRLRLGVAIDGFDYELVLGLPEPNDVPSSFLLDPMIKEETVTFRERAGKAAVTLVKRNKSGVELRAANGQRVTLPMSLTRSESILSQLSEPHRYPHVAALRELLAGWRFYHGFRTDDAAPLRQPQIGVFTSVLRHDGVDLAAALQTIIEIGDADGLHRAIRRGLGGATLFIDAPEARFRVRLQMPGVVRPLEAWELSDGTLRYLCLLAALLSPRPPSLLALNEPETSLHPELLEPLARLITDVSDRSQLWITTHSEVLAGHIARFSGVQPVTLIKSNGETRLAASAGGTGAQPATVNATVTDTGFRFDE